MVLFAWCTLRGSNCIDLLLKVLDTCPWVYIIKKMSSRNKGKSLVTFPADYVVLDIETTGLDTRYDSIIELSAVKVSGDTVLDTFTTLINPQRPLDEFIVAFTGITDAMLEDAPVIDEALNGFIEFVGDSVIVGHNVNFDINFIYDNYKRITSKDFTNDFVDTLRLARFILKDLGHHRLGDLVDYFNLGYTVEHRGLSDTHLTLAVLLELEKMAIAEYGDTASFEQTFNARAYAHKVGVRAKDITASATDFDITHPLWGKHCVFTGALEKMQRKEAFQIVADCGGVIEDGVNKRINYLIVGSLEYSHTVEKGKSSKLKKVEQMILDGKDVQILSENAFYDMIMVDMP